MLTKAFISGLALFASSAVVADTLQIGDGRIDGRKIAAYELTWQQCVANDGRWQNQNKLSESLVVIGDATLRHRQLVNRPDGLTSVATTYFDRASFAPLRMEVNVRAGDGTLILESERELTVTGYTGWAFRGGETKQLEGIVSSNMLHGGAMGLPLATLPFQTSPIEFAASMMNFDASYRVIATWAGTGTLEYGDQEIEAFLVDIEWHHEGLGDVYPPGPDASGGRYWIVPEPPKGFPYVPRYKTDTYAVEFVQGACPE